MRVVQSILAGAIALTAACSTLQETKTAMPEITNHTINYIEFPLTNPEATKAFYNKAFGWEFTEWGPDYLSFSGAGVEGGFNREDGVEPANPGVLVVLYGSNLEKSLTMVKDAGGAISKEIFDFPGGRRFHFRDPNGNELAIWSEK